MVARVVIVPVMFGNAKGNGFLMGKGQHLTRTIERVVDLSNSTTITSDDLLEADRDGYQRIRRAATKARLDGQIRFACDRCGYGVYAPIDPRTSRPYWKHHRGAPASCPWWTGQSSSIDQVSAHQFRGDQERPLHFHLKHTLGELLKIDPDTEDGSVVVDHNLVTAEGYRRPDVRAIHANRRIAIEIQLASTQIPIIVAREAFYEREGYGLLWVTWQFDPNERARMLMAFEDIFYSHNKNLFSLDSEVIQRSRDERRVLLRVFWEDGDQWDSKIVPLSDLNWPQSGLAYAVSPKPAWHDDICGRWRSITTLGGTPWQAKVAFYVEICKKLDLDEVAENLSELDLGGLLNCIFSCIDGKPFGSEQSNLIETVNTFLYAVHRHRYARILRAILIKTGNEAILSRLSVQTKIEAAMLTPQDGPESTSGKIVLALFPKLFTKGAKKVAQ